MHDLHLGSIYISISILYLGTHNVKGGGDRF